MSFMKNTDKPWIVITPAGKIFVESASEAVWYKENYGYGYARNPDYMPSDTKN